jgi:hypothetical protein
MIDRRKSAPLQLEKAEKLESGQVGEGRVRSGRGVSGRGGSVRVGSGEVKSCQGESGESCPLDLCSDLLRDVTC